ncbi:hypothetical protein D6855_10270 [Butyrivibrio sp. CB08]|nr:hypothetical protein D6855_10270 [Butyrivibrio sp. CB08]
MLSFLFTIMFFVIFWKMIGFALRASWGIFKIVMYLVFLPAILIGLAVGGLVYVALPILLVAGLFSLLAHA